MRRSTIQCDYDRHACRSIEPGVSAVIDLSTVLTGTEASQTSDSESHTINLRIVELRRKLACLGDMLQQPGSLN